VAAPRGGTIESQGRNTFHEEINARGTLRVRDYRNGWRTVRSSMRHVILAISEADCAVSRPGRFAVRRFEQLLTRGSAGRRERLTSSESLTIDKNDSIKFGGYVAGYATCRRHIQRFDHGIHGITRTN
jgi:hypothetical protein